MTHPRAFLNTAVTVMATLLCLGCAGGASRGPGTEPVMPDHDGAQATVLRNTSGVPIGVRVRWGAVDNVAGYHLYRSSSSIPDTARGDSAFWVTIGGDTHIPQSAGVNVLADDLFTVNIGETWFYRVTSINSQGEESLLSEESSLTISPFLVTELQTLRARPGELIRISGSNFGLYDSATDKVRVQGVEWVTGVGFQPIMIECSIFDWEVNQIQARIPTGATIGQVEVSIAGDAQLTPETFENSAPYVTSMLPITGDTLTQVEIQGGNFGASFSPDNVVVFATQDELDPSRYVSWSDNQILFLPPTYRNFQEHELQVKVFDTSVGAYLSSNTGFFDLQNAPPVTYLRANPNAGGAPLDVVLTPGQLNGPVIEFSFDPNAFPLTEYRYDFEDDGTVDLLMFDNSNVTHQYASRGTFVCRLTCVDLDGATSSATVTVTPGNNAPTAQVGAIPPAGTVPFQVAFDASGSTDIDGTIAKYEWDFDGDGTFEFDSGAANKANHYYNFQGSYSAAVRVTDNDGASATAVATVTANAPSGHHILVIRNDGGGYSGNYNALITDLSDIPANYDTIGYHSTVADSVLGGGYELAIWYRGGPGSGADLGLEVEPDVRVWTTQEIDNYLQIMQDGNGVLLFSQNHGKVSEMDAAIPNGWTDITGYGFTLVANGIPDAEKRHPWAAGLATNLGVHPNGVIPQIPTSPASVKGNITGAAVGADSGNAAERYSGADSSGARPLDLSLPTARQFCALGYNSNLLPPACRSAGFRAGFFLSPNFFGTDCALLSWGNVNAPDQNIGDGPAYSHTLGPGKLYIVGYSWGEMSVATPLGTTNAQVLQNMIAWFGTGLM
jgi:PKD domain